MVVAARFLAAGAPHNIVCLRGSRRDPSRLEAEAAIGQMRHEAILLDAFRPDVWKAGRPNLHRSHTGFGAVLRLMEDVVVIDRDQPQMLSVGVEVVSHRNLGHRLVGKLPSDLRLAGTGREDGLVAVRRGDGSPRAAFIVDRQVDAGRPTNRGDDVSLGQ